MAGITVMPRLPAPSLALSAATSSAGPPLPCSWWPLWPVRVTLCPGTPLSDSQASFCQSPGVWTRASPWPLTHKDSQGDEDDAGGHDGGEGRPAAHGICSQDVLGGSRHQPQVTGRGLHGSRTQGRRPGGQQKGGREVRSALGGHFSSPKQGSSLCKRSCHH